MEEKTDELASAAVVAAADEAVVSPAEGKEREIAASGASAPSTDAGGENGDGCGGAVHSASTLPRLASTAPAGDGSAQASASQAGSMASRGPLAVIWYMGKGP